MTEKLNFKSINRSALLGWILNHNIQSPLLHMGVYRSITYNFGTLVRWIQLFSYDELEHLWQVVNSVNVTWKNKTANKSNIQLGI